MADTKDPHAGYAYTLHFNEGPFGSGQREVIVATVGRKWITIVDPNRLDVARVPAAEWPDFKPRRAVVSTNFHTARRGAIKVIHGPHDTAKRLRRRARFLTRLGVPFPEARIKKIATSLEKETSNA